MDKQTLGKYGEHIAAEYLQTTGYDIIEQRFTSTSGEIDIVACNGEALVFIEVKTRTGVLAGHGSEAIVPTKLFRMKKCLIEWLASRDATTQLELRLDLISITIQENQHPYIEHYEGVSL